MTRVVAVLQLRELSSNVSNIELRTLPPGGVKLGKNRQTAAELSGNSNSPVFYSHFHQHPNISAEISERRRFSGLAAIQSPIKRTQHRQTEIRLVLNLTRSTGARPIALRELDQSDYDRSGREGVLTIQHRPSPKAANPEELTENAWLTAKPKSTGLKNG